jgi:hypothetical protein
MKPNKENIITDILIQLEEGTERGKCLSKIVEKWQISSRTFDRHWKVANERHLINRQSINTVIAEVYVEAEKERFKKAILSKDEALQILTDIANGKKTLVGKGSLIPTFAERRMAIQTMADIQGWKSDTKIQVSGNIDMQSDEARKARIAQLIEKATQKPS